MLTILDTTKFQPIKSEVVIISVPHCEPYPMVAPALLSACLNSAGIVSQGIDFSAIFIDNFGKEDWFVKFKTFITFGHMSEFDLTLAEFKTIYKFTKKFFTEIKTLYNPTYIGLSIFSTDSLDFGIFISYILKKHFPEIKIIAGGKGLEVTHQNQEKHYDIWYRHGIADTIVIGDAETEVINSIKYNKTGLVFAPKQKKEDLDNIPLADWNRYDLSIYDRISDCIDRGDNSKQEIYIAVTASKGCVRQCTFCDVAEFWPDYIYRDPVKVANEIIHNYQHTKIKDFVFTDNLINGSIKNFRIMNEVLIEKIPNTIRYGGYAIFRGKNQMPEQDFELAARAGCWRWTIGVESGSEKIRNEMRKKFSNDDIDWTVEMLVKNNITQSWLFMVGYPSETEEDFNETKNLLKQYHYLGKKGMIKIGITPTFSLTNNSPLLNNLDMASDYGLIHNLTNTESSTKFWTSTKYIDNTYPVRSRRWKEFIALCKNLGYTFHFNMSIEKFSKEIELLDALYEQTKNKIIPIYKS